MGFRSDVIWPVFRLGFISASLMVFMDRAKQITEQLIEGDFFSCRFSVPVFFSLSHCQFPSPEPWLWRCRTLPALTKVGAQNTLCSFQTLLHINKGHEHHLLLVLDRYQPWSLCLGGPSAEQSLPYLSAEMLSEMQRCSPRRNKHCETGWSCSHCCVSVQGTPKRKG